MNKKIMSLTLLIACYATSVSAAGTLVLVWATKLSEEMFVDDVQHVRTKSIHIKKEYDNHGKSVIEVSEKDPDKWTITALNPGKVDVIIHKCMSGFKSKLRMCHHTITVKAKKGSKAESKADKKAERKRTAASKR